MEKILIDTDVIIDFLRGHKKRIATLFIRVERKEIKAFISQISIVELYAGEDIEDKDKEIVILRLLAFFGIIPIDINLGKLAGRLKRKYRLGLADSIIAASALESKLKLFTFNTKHFKDIPNLKIYSLNGKFYGV